MNQEHLAEVVREDDTDGMATFDDFAFEELEDRLELETVCWECYNIGGQVHCFRVACPF